MRNKLYSKNNYKENYVFLNKKIKFLKFRNLKKQNNYSERFFFILENIGLYSSTLI